MNRRIFVYGAIITSFVFAVYIKQNIITKKGNRTVTTMPSEWKEKGKPVVLEEIAKKNVKTYTKITVTQEKASLPYVYIPYVTQQKLQVGQLIFSDDMSKNPIGKIVEVTKDIDLDTGMFFVKVSLDEKFLANKPRAIVYVNTGILENVICLPRKVVVIENGDRYVWAVKENKAYKVPVVIGKRNGYGFVIKEGLKEGDLVVLHGNSKLTEGDKVNILKEYPGVEND